jgi:hypothetical protein
MDGWTTTMRELTPAETAFVSGAFTWEGLGSAMLTGAIVGGLGAATRSATYSCTASDATGRRRDSAPPAPLCPRRNG